MKRLTTDTPKNNLQNALNLFYIKDNETWVRGGGPGPEYEDVSLFAFTRQIVRDHAPDIDLPDDDDSLSNIMPEWLCDGPDTMEGIIALIYTAAWTYAELRHRLMQYEDTGLAPNTIEAIFGTFHESDRAKLEELRALLRAKHDGRLVVLPCKIGDEVWGIRNYRGKMHPQRGRVNDMFFTKDMRLMIVVKHICYGIWGEKVFSTREEAEAAIRGEETP